jgi:hypothetical protein
MKRLTLFGLCGLTILAAASCGASFNHEVTQDLRNWLSEVPGMGWMEPVTAIAATPNLQPGQEVLLEGRVEQHLPLIGQGLYQLSDETGSTWVVGPTSPPPVGETLKIRAAVRYEPILMAGQDIGEYYVEELARYPQE